MSLEAVTLQLGAVTGSCSRRFDRYYDVVHDEFEPSSSKSFKILTMTKQTRSLSSGGDDAVISGLIDRAVWIYSFISVYMSWREKTVRFHLSEQCCETAALKRSHFPLISH